MRLLSRYLKYIEERTTTEIDQWHGVMKLGAHANDGGGTTCGKGLPFMRARTISCGFRLLKGTLSSSISSSICSGDPRPITTLNRLQ